MRYASLCAIGLLLPSVSLASPLDSVSLKIISKSENVAAAADKAALLEPPGYTLSLRNESTQTITAWQLSCLYAQGNGEFGTTKLELDGLQESERDPSESTTSGGVIRPGSEFDLVVPRDTQAGHPYQATACRVSAVLYADGSSAGESGAIASLLGNRARIATAAANSTEILEKTIAEGFSPDVRLSNRPDTGSDLPGKTLVIPPNKFKELEGCTIDGGGTGLAENSCLWLVKDRSFNVSASCRNVCTGATWQLNSPTVTAHGECPDCSSDWEWRNKKGPDGYTTISWSSVATGYRNATGGGCEAFEGVVAAVTCECPGCGNPSPILVSLSDEIYQLTDADGGVRFDLDADGKPEQTAWTAFDSDEAFLALDRNLNGIIDDYMEIFGNHTPQLPSIEANGWLALAVWDDSFNGGNENGVIDVNDFIFTALQLWVDENHNGISEPEELSSLEEAGVEYLDLDYGRSNRTDSFGNEFRFWSKVGLAGGVRIAWDVFFVHE